MRKPRITARITARTNYKYVTYRLSHLPFFGSKRVHYKLHMRKLYTRHFVVGMNLKRYSANKHIGNKAC